MAGVCGRGLARLPRRSKESGLPLLHRTGMEQRHRAASDPRGEEEKGERNLAAKTAELHAESYATRPKM